MDSVPARSEAPAPPPAVVVIAAHGSRAEPANAAHRALVVAVAARSAIPVLAAFLELAEPSIPDALDRAAGSGAPRVVLLPYFLHPGNHVAVDLVGLVADAGRRHPATAFVLGDPFGADPAVVGLLAAQVVAASTDPAGGGDGGYSTIV